MEDGNFKSWAMLVWKCFTRLVYGLFRTSEEFDFISEKVGIVVELLAKYLNHVPYFIKEHGYCGRVIG